MRTFRLKLRIASSWCTPWHADTLFAALCWQVRALRGEGELRVMLELFRRREAPFVISDAFPDGWLPCPLSAKLQSLPASNFQTKLPLWLREEQFRALIRQPAAIPPMMEWPNPLSTSRSLHASVDRALGNTSGISQLFEIETEYFSAGNGNRPGHLVLYVRTENWIGELVRLLRSLSNVGFGKKRSSGNGAFQLVDDPEPCDWMDENGRANAFVSLSHFVPSSDDPTDGRWGVLVKYPKFSPEAPVSRPFKGRLLMLRPGSVFRTVGSIRPFYGTLLERISPEFPDAVHYALAFPVPMQWPPEEAA